MIIITPGDALADQGYEGECRQCRAEVKFRYEETEGVFQDPVLGELLYVRCPTADCGQVIYSPLR
jgi:hypothetical protein